MKTYHIAAFFSIAVILLSASCRQSSSATKTGEDTRVEKKLKSPAKFNRDSAYSYVRHQVSFGPRVSGTPENVACRKYIVNELTRHGGKNVRVQTGEVEAFNGDRLPIGNVMASFGPDVKDRILLVAHYDTRPWCDSDMNEENRLKPVIGANDGGSGVGVLLEVARSLGQTEPPIGVDFLMVDAEDYGQASGFSTHDTSWCLGTQYWVKHMPYAQDSLPRYAVILDMVGGIGAKFHREFFSEENARNIVDKVWSIAARSGYDSRFVNKNGGSVVDDHLFINDAGIPAIDIIESKNDNTGTFPPTWHTINDTMENIDPASLEAVGQTVLNLIHNEIVCKE